MIDVVFYYATVHSGADFQGVHFVILFISLYDSFQVGVYFGLLKRRFVAILDEVARSVRSE